MPPRADTRSSTATSEGEGEQRLWISIDGTDYDVTEYHKRHPGGSVIDFMFANNGADATETFKEFHMRSKKADKVLKSLKTRPTVPGNVSAKDQKMLANFAKFRHELEVDGFFEPSKAHLAFRVAELAAFFAGGLWLFAQEGTAAKVLGVVAHGLFGARCGWLQHEGGHNSLTGIIPVDKQIQNAFIGFGLGTSGYMWNSMHQKHHATPQKIGHDMDLDTTPLVAFFDTAVEDNRPRPLLKLWLRLQAYTFLPVTSGGFVMLFWLSYLHPRAVVRNAKWGQAFWMACAHVVRSYAISHATGWTWASSYAATWACMWVSGVYLFGHFALSHTHLPTVDRMEHVSWVHYAVDHTTDISTQSTAVNWIMGYLNCQVLHHLFPNMPQFRQPAASLRFEVFCKENGLAYKNVSYFQAWKDLFSNLDEVGTHYFEEGFDEERQQLAKAQVKALKKVSAVGGGSARKDAASKKVQ